MDYWIYTGETMQEAINKSNVAVTLIDAKGQEIFGGNVVGAAQIFANPPTIGGVIYYCGFQAPPDIFINGATCDLITEWDSGWFEEI